MPPEGGATGRDGFAEDAASLLEQGLTPSKFSVMEGIQSQDPRKLKRRKRMWVSLVCEGQRQIKIYMKRVERMFKHWV